MRHQNRPTKNLHLSISFFDVLPPMKSPKWLLFSMGIWASPMIHASGWGYSYQNLLDDLNQWKTSPSVKVDSLGPSVQNRAIWRITLENPSAHPTATILIHARTHPLEVQGFYVLKAMIDSLIHSSKDSKLLDLYRFEIIPMANPDGVELGETNPCSAGEGRCNSQGVDLEREWAKDNPQVEVQVLKKFFEQKLVLNPPVKIALNFHSAFGCDRFFWAHDPLGTSDFFWAEQKRFIEGVRAGSSVDILPYSAKISWKTGNPGYFPESWWWNNQKEKVMALTYEDRKNCPTGEDGYEQSAQAILVGIDSYLQNKALPTKPELNLSWQKAQWYDLQGRFLFEQWNTGFTQIQRPDYQGTLVLIKWTKWDSETSLSPSQ